jgi:hypothetical protein
MRDSPEPCCERPCRPKPQASNPPCALLALAGAIPCPSPRPASAHLLAPRPTPSPFPTEPTPHRPPAPLSPRPSAPRPPTRRAHARPRSLSSRVRLRLTPMSPSLPADRSHAPLRRVATGPSDGGGPAHRGGGRCGCELDGAGGCGGGGVVCVRGSRLWLVGQPPCPLRQAPRRK